MSGVRATLDIIHTIGTLDRCLSEMIILSSNERIDEADRQTLKHHAKDMIAASIKILERLGEVRTQELAQRLSRSLVDINDPSV